MPLTDTAIRAAKPAEKAQKLFDGKGLYLLITPSGTKSWMHAIYNYHGSLVVKSALQLIALTFCRTTEIRCAEWQDFDFEGKLWRIPAECMKIRRDHLVPLSRQTLAVLEKLRAYSDSNQYVFPSCRSEAIPFGKTALSRAIRRMGFEEDKMCPTASALWPPPC